MLRSTVALFGALMLGMAVPNEASAGGVRFFFGRSPVYRYRHAAVHHDLGHREVERHLIHDEAHTYPMTWWQHGGMHRSLRRDAIGGHLDHSRWHGYNDYNRYGGGLIIGGGHHRRYGHGSGIIIRF